MTVLTQNALVEDVVAVARFVKAHNGKVTKEDLIMDIFRVSPEHKEAYKSAGDRIARVARATKDSNDSLARDIYTEVYGQKGTLQSIIVKGVMYYYHIPWLDGVGLLSFNPRSVEDVTELIHKMVKAHDYLNTMPTASDVVIKMAVKHGYVMGTIAPTVGTILAIAKEKGLNAGIAQKCIDVMKEKSNK